MACRAENSFTHRHLCEFTGLDFEMAINEHYSEVMDVIDKLFVYIFTGLNAKYGKALCSLTVLLLGGSPAMLLQPALLFISEGQLYMIVVWLGGR